MKRKRRNGEKSIWLVLHFYRSRDFETQVHPMKRAILHSAQLRQGHVVASAAIVLSTNQGYASTPSHFIHSSFSCDSEYHTRARTPRARTSAASCVEFMRCTLLHPTFFHTALACVMQRIHVIKAMSNCLCVCI